MSDFGTPPEIPTALQQYNSYVEDPKWQRKFSMVWAITVAIAIVLSARHFIRAMYQGRAFTGLFGVSEDNTGKSYTPINVEEKVPIHSKRRIAGFAHSVLALFSWTLPGVELSFGQMIIVGGYLATVLICIVMKAELVNNPNRAGFLALAQLPVVFLFGTKNSVVSLLLGPGHGYEKLNYIHRWSGRGLFIGAAVHGVLWIRNHLQYGLAILGSQKETSGVAAFGLLCVIVLTSLRPIRRLFYQGFWVVHVLGYVAFFVTICYHTIYASPWIFPPLAFYGLDILLRLFRYRIKDASLTAVDQNMTIINIHDCDAGWQAGQHVRLRVFFSNRIFESHPLTILNAPPSSSCLPNNRSMTLAARACGDWTRALNSYALGEQERLDNNKLNEKLDSIQVPVHVMIDGPYGGSSVDLGEYESVLLIAGGSGATFTIGLLDDIVARCVKLGRKNGERTRRIEFAWCIRSFACIEWFSPMLMEIANIVATSSSLDLHISIYVTCLCDPSAVPPIPNSDVTVFRPSVTTLLQELVSPPESLPSQARLSALSTHSSDSHSNEDDDAEEDLEKCMKSKLQWVGLGGGVAVCASGPESLIRESQNAVAKMGVMRGVELGGVALHTELFAL
ncbi:hypothetical protein QCA50_020021 [Cerrena zonata]|uniref:ferric-chelate reductase (NADPH) n=1 Tax=Cerrena zonata TaxID=2478898 RepID=A0AAW0FIH5_9APHY